MRVAGEERLIAVEDAGRYRDALGVGVPRGVPDAFLEPVDDALTQLVRRWARTHGPFLTAEPARAVRAVGADRVDEVLRQLVDDGRAVARRVPPDGAEREWCDAEVLRSLRQRSLAALRREVEPTEAEALARFLPGLARRRLRRPAGLDRAATRSWRQLQGVAIPASVLERDVLSGARARLLAPPARRAAGRRRGACGSAPAPSAATTARSCCSCASQAPAARPARAAAGERPDGPEHERLRERAGRSGVRASSAS